MRSVLSPCLAASVIVLAACCSRSSDSSETDPSGGAPSGPNYAIEVRAPAKTAVGTEATAEVLVTPRNGFKMNLEYPSKLQLKTVPPGTKVAAERISKRQMSIDEKRLSVPVRFTPEGPGEKRFEGELRFSVCDAKTCVMPTEAVSFTTVAEGEALAPAAGDAAPPEGDAEPGPGRTPDAGAAAP